MSRHGMAATSQPLATAAAIRVLQDGGTAVDAAAVEVLPSTTAGHQTVTAHEPSAAEPIVMFVRDAQAGEIAVLVRGDEVVFRDRALVAKVQRIIAKEGK